MNSIDSEHTTGSAGRNKIFAEYVHHGAMHLGQSKLYFCRALRTMPSDRPRLKRILESLTAGLQFAIESAHRIVVPR